MVILELAVQGVKGLAPAVRLALKGGYTLLQPQSPGGSLWQLLDALCYADPRTTDTRNLIAPGAAQARAGLTFQGRDGQTYRLVRELGGSGQLARMDAASGKLVAVSQDASEILQYLRATVGLPTRGVYEQAFTFRANQWPSSQVARPVSKPAAAVGKPGLATSALAQAALAGRLQPSQAQPVADVAAAQAQLKQLREELAATKEVDELQFRLDGLQKRTYELGAKLRQVDTLRQDLARLEAQVQAAPSPVSLGLPENVAERAARMEQLEKVRDDQLRRLDREREQFLGQEHSVQPLTKEPAFLAALGVGLLAVVLGFSLGHSWRYLALLDIPAFGFAAAMALRWVGDVQANESRGRRRAHYDDRERQIRDAYENEVLSVKTAMKLLNVSAPNELIDVLAHRQTLERQLADGQAQLAALEADPTVAQARQEIGEAQREQTEVEDRLGKLSSFSRAAHQVESDIEELEAGIRAAQNPTAPAAAPPTAAASPEAPAASGGAPGEDPVPKLISAAGDLFNADAAGVGALVVPRAAQYLAALTDRRLSGLEVNHQGQALVATAQGKVPAGKLEAADRDLLYLAVRLALVEKYAERGPLPVVIDDAFSKFDAAKQALIGRLLKHLGTKLQVVHLSTSPATEAQADTRFTV